MVPSEIKASIIIPARDATATIEKAVQSVLNEICSEDVEIIIVNDGIDDSLALLADRYPVRAIDGDGTGPAAARNIGVAFSRGNILIFLDADCRVKAGWLSTHLATHSRYNGLLAVGGSICMEPDAPLWARCAIDPQKPVFECSYTGSNPRPNNKELEVSLGITGSPTVVYTGTFASYQGLEDLLEAAVLVRAEIPGVVFILVGGTEPELKHFRKLAEKYGLANTVKLQLRRPRQEIPDFLALADVLVLARKSGKNVPLKIYDYLKSEKPIVATDIPAHRAILNEKTAVLVEPNPAALSGGILRALKDTNLSKKAGRTVEASLSANPMKSLRETIAEAYGRIIDKST